MMIIDAKGLLSPEPLKQTELAFAELPAGAKFVILLDNEAAVQEVHKFLQDNDAVVEVDKEDEIYKISATKSEEEERVTCAELGQVALGQQVYTIRNNVANNGLKVNMVNEFFRAVPELNPLPSRILFLEQGVNLVLEDSAYVEKIQKLEKLGISILVCRNSVEYYGLSEKVKVGELIDFFEIVKCLNAAAKIINI